MEQMADVLDGRGGMLPVVASTLYSRAFVLAEGKGVFLNG